MQSANIILHANAQPATFNLVAANEEMTPLSVHPVTPNALERDLASNHIGPFGWIGIAFCIIIVVIAATSIFNAAKARNAKNMVDK